MKQIKETSSFFYKFFKQKKGAVPNIEAGFLPVVLDFSKSPVLLFCNTEDVKSLSFYYKDRIGKDVACVAAPELDSPGGFVGFYDNLFQTSINFINSSRPFLCIFDVSLKESLLFSADPPKSFFAGPGIEYEELLSVLKNFKYDLSEELVFDGSFFARGGIVDVRPFGSVECFRVSFLQESVVFYKIGSEKQITSVVSGINIAPRKTETKKNISSVFQKKHLCLLYKNKQLSFSRSLKNKKLNFSCFVVDFQNYNKNKGSYNVVESPFLKDVGYLVGGGVCFVPPWFLSGYKKEIVASVNNSTEFVVGSYYVYAEFGVCQFLGLEGSDVGYERACFKFLDGVVRLSVSLLGDVFFYSHDLEGSFLSSLSKKTRWQKTRQKACDKASLYVEDLVVYYKTRSKAFRNPYFLNQKILNTFLGSFEFKETKDQSVAWGEVLRDMSSAVPMNRLLCGDVGFGKTEIAIRAAFVASFSSKKTIVIAPTTVLSEQLFSCFKKRLSPFGVCVDKYFKGAQKTTSLASFLSGHTDVLISTHSVLYKKDILASCSLFIVDEEHRFGVKDKELVFKYAPNVDYLSLSATPIPRTMQMSLSNIKNISMIQSPPVARKPIISQISYYSFDFLVRVVFEEINRNGQVYFVDNSVDNVVFLFNKFVRLFPNVSFSKIYGSLPVKENQNTMLLFRQKKIDVLFATTIIESGVDVASVNTIIINNSHLFGLSQLYQLRGRVGRSSVQGFCYFLIPKKRTLSPSAKKRLSAILKYRTLGSGYNLALSDLDSRGFGSLFGYGQSGSVGVGYEMYSKIVGDALVSSNKRSLVVFSDVAISGGSIPDSFISSDSLRAFYYREIFSSSTLKNLVAIKKKIISVFGFCHYSVLLLLKDRLLSFRASRAGIKSLSCVDQKIVFVFCSSFYKKRGVGFFHSIARVCDGDSVNYVFKTDKNSLSLSCVLSEKNTFSFSKKIIRAVLK